MERNELFPNCKALTYGIIEDELYPLVRSKGWGFSMPDCLHMIADHMEATGTIANNENMLGTYSDREEYLAKEKIEFMLEDCNFHTLCGFLLDEEYAKATKWVLNEYMEGE